MPESHDDGHWHLKKEVTLGHIYTIASILFAVIVWGVTMQIQLQVLEDRTEANAASIGRQYSEIVRQLDKIDDKIDKHMRQHVNGDE